MNASEFAGLFDACPLPPFTFRSRSVQWMGPRALVVRFVGSGDWAGITLMLGYQKLPPAGVITICEVAGLAPKEVPMNVRDLGISIAACEWSAKVAG